MRSLHILAGLLALLGGAFALCATKGSPWHRRSGTLFVIAMLVMSSSSVFMAAFLRPNIVNTTAGLITLYLVCTGWLTVSRSVAQSRGLLTGLMCAALIVGAFAARLGVDGLRSPSGRVDSIPAPALLLFAIVGIAGGLLDARILVIGNIQGSHRLARHLWRLGFALWIAAMSFFLGQAKLFPEPLRKSGLLPVPVLLLAATLIYWLVRVLRRRRGTNAAAPTTDPVRGSA